MRGGGVAITRRTDYAIRMLAMLAEGDACPVSVRTLADACGVPYSFARAVQRDLTAGGLVSAVRGVAGGLCLARPTADITLLQIIEATQGDLSISVCANDPAWCERSGACRAHQVWRGADALLNEYLGSKTLAGLVSTQGR
jgi:Rrf2 family protein